MATKIEVLVIYIKGFYLKSEEVKSENKISDEIFNFFKFDLQL